jgi:hypothetical protein
MNLAQIVDAAKLDILALLGRDTQGIYEFRRVSHVAALMCDLIDSAGQPHEHGQIVRVMREAEDRHINLFNALMGRAFDGQEALRRKYEELQQHHRQLKVAQLGIEDAAARIDVERAVIEVGKKALTAHAEALERERERLHLLAAGEGVEIKLPALPELPAMLMEEDVKEGGVGVHDHRPASDADI